MEGIAWLVQGEDRAEGAIGIMEAFKTIVNTQTREGAVELAREKRYNAGREHVRIISIERVS